MTNTGALEKASSFAEGATLNAGCLAAHWESRQAGLHTCCKQKWLPHRSFAHSQALASGTHQPSWHETIFEPGDSSSSAFPLTAAMYWSVSQSNGVLMSCTITTLAPAGVS